MHIYEFSSKHSSKVNSKLSSKVNSKHSFKVNSKLLIKFLTCVFQIILNKQVHKGLKCIIILKLELLN